ncbi:MAG: transporter substrate-binding domain-containing protein [Sedimentibacter sp.]|uniref:transporter substrate-binding domain-containing protein n=1 Tax=Sedimentibacter sp. TaxID=1960295 RepID=UPI00315871B0
MIKRIAVLSVLVLLMNMSAAYGYGAAGTYRVAGDIQFPPYEFLDSDGIYKGFNVDLLKAISLVTGMEFEFIPMKWEEAFYSIERGQADIIEGMKESNDRRTRFNFTDSLLMNSQSVFVRNNYYSINNNSDLAGKIVSVQKEDIVYLELSRIKDIKIIQYDTMEEAVEALIDGEVEAMVGNTLTVNYICKENSWIDQIKIVGQTLNQQKYSMAVSKNNPQLLRKLNEGLAEIQNNGMYDALHRKWFGTPIKNTSKEAEGQIIMLLFSLFVLLLIILIVQLINRKLNRIIEEKTREEKILINELRNYDKLQFMDKIISSLAHEIRNPLTSIKIYTTQMKNKLENKEFMLAAAEDIPEEIDRIDAMIKEFMEYTSPRKPQIRVLNLKNELENAIKFIKLQIRNIYVDLQIADDIYIQFDSSHFKQIVINILLNSKDALMGTENPSIRINGCSHGEYVNIEFADNGCGMDEKSLDYIFEPFYTTKDNGNGVGMFVVKKLVEENGGKIEAKNNENTNGLAVFLTVRMGERNEN